MKSQGKEKPLGRIRSGWPEVQFTDKPKARWNWNAAAWAECKKALRGERPTAARKKKPDALGQARALLAATAATASAGSAKKGK